MQRNELYRRGAEAAEDIASCLLRVDVRKALDPLRPRDFVVILDRIGRRVNAAMVGEEAAAMAAALDALDIRWASLNETQVAKIVRGANEILRNKLVASVPPVLNGVLEIEGPPLAARTRASAVKRYGLSIGSDLRTRDRKAEKNVRKLTTNYVRDEMGTRADAVSEKARTIVESGLKRGHDSITIGRRLKAELGTRVARGGRGYWRMVANSFGAHARTFAQVGALHEARFEQWVFDAVLDEATSNVCRFYHGRTFPMTAAARHVDRITELDDPEDVTEISPWVQEGSDDDGDFLYVTRGNRQHRIAGIRRSGIGARDDVGDFEDHEGTDGLMQLGTMMPPLHGNCRSTIVPA
jgi:hypothetical protein